MYKELQQNKCPMSFVSYFALDATKSRVSQGHLCWVLFSNVSWFRSAIEYANKRFKGLSTFYFTVSTVCSCLHSLGGAFWVSGSDGILVAKTCLWFVSLPETQKVPPKECAIEYAIESDLY